MTELRARLAALRMPIRLAYVGLLLLATLVPFGLDPDLGRAFERLARAWSPTLTARDWIDAARNVALFAGWGVVWMITAPVERAWLSLREAVLTGAALSLGVELAQSLSSLRNPNAVDLLTNTGGALLGALGLVALVMVAGAGRGAKSFVGIPALAFAGPYAIAAFLEALIPLFRQNAFPNVYGGPLGRFRVVWQMFEVRSLFDLPFEDFLLFLPAGALAVAAAVERGWGYGPAARRVSLVGLLLAALAEVAHGLVGQPIILGAIVLHALAIAAGAFAAVQLLPQLTQRYRGRQRPFGVLVAYAIVLALWGLRPYTIEWSGAAIAQKLSMDWWIPLAALSVQMDFFSVVDVCGPFFLYLPLGALLAVWPLRFTGRWSHAWPGLYLAAATEVGQLVLVGRMLDVTDLLIQASGVLIGWAVVRRGGFLPYGEVRPARG